LCSTQEIEQLLDNSGSWPSVILGYAAMLRARRIELNDDQYDTPLPQPVLPIVDAANLEIRHTARGGGTNLTVDSMRLSISCRRPFNLNSNRGLAIVLLGMASYPDGSCAVPEFWVNARSAPSDDAVFGAFLLLRAAGFGDDEAVALMSPAGLVPDPTAIGRTVLGWDAVDDIDRRMWLYRASVRAADDPLLPGTPRTAPRRCQRVRLPL
jgi:hypothetical protein